MAAPASPTMPTDWWTSCRDASRWEGLFFWSSYFTDDLISGVERALALPGRIDAPARSRGWTGCGQPSTTIHTWWSSMASNDCSRPPARLGEVGLWVGPSARFSKWWAVGRARAPSFSLPGFWPQELDAFHEKAPRQVRPRARCATVDEGRRRDRPVPFGAARRALCALLTARRSRLWIGARRTLPGARAGRRGGASAPAAPAPAPDAPDRRVWRMIRELLLELDHRTGRMTTALLRHLAAFMSPVPAATLEVCYLLGRSGLDPDEVPTLRDLTGLLLESRLLFGLGPERGRAKKPASGSTRRCAATSSTRRSRWRRTRCRVCRSRVTPPGPTPWPLRRGTRPRSWGASSIALHRRRAGLARAAAGARPSALRVAFGVLRSRTESNTSPRWTTYADYIQLGIRLTDLARLVAPRRWHHGVRGDLGLFEDEDGPLYADELAWLYNDIGLTLCSEGEMQEAYAVWEQGFEINRLIDREGGQYVVQSLLHLGHVFLELGHLRHADRLPLRVRAGEPGPRRCRLPSADRRATRL